MSKRFFINNIDTIIGKAILKELVKDEEADPIHMGTYRDRTQTSKPKGIKKILKREKPKLQRKKMLEECDIYVYDLHFGDFKDIEYGVNIFTKDLEEQKVFILISDVLTWD
jgi:adenylate kinase